MNVGMDVGTKDIMQCMMDREHRMLTLNTNVGTKAGTKLGT